MIIEHTDLYFSKHDISDAVMAAEADIWSDERRTQVQALTTDFTASELYLQWESEIQTKAEGIGNRRDTQLGLIRHHVTGRKQSSKR